MDDHAIVRRGLVHLVEEDGSYKVVGEAGSAAEAQRVITETRPDVAIVDICLGGPDGIQLTRSLMVRHPNIRVLVLSGMSESLFAQQALDAGANGYLMKDHAPDALHEALATVKNGGIWVSPEMRQKLRFGGEQTPEVDLSDTERVVLDAMGAGAGTAPAIARLTELDEGRVREAWRRLMRKLGLHGTTELRLHADAWHRQRGAG